MISEINESVTSLFKKKRIEILLFVRLLMPLKRMARHISIFMRETDLDLEKKQLLVGKKIVRLKIIYLISPSTSQT